MNEQQYERVKKACESQRAKGVKLVQASWGVEYDSFTGYWDFKKGDVEYGQCACALGCLLLEEQPTSLSEAPATSSDQELAAAAALETTGVNVMAFVSAFDEPWNYAMCPDDDLDAWEAAGLRLARELVLDDPTEHDEAA